MVAEAAVEVRLLYLEMGMAAQIHCQAEPEIPPPMMPMPKAGLLLFMLILVMVLLFGYDDHGEVIAIDKYTTNHTNYYHCE
ncbi:hypothetical protein ACNFIA_31620 [Pseudomonas sp. NY15437]|uniref:hypothetical protein n=1 Tax=Pseudomonas sp. NY15437 TaxID=3400360 RepID=UPI003A88CDF7